MYNSITLASYVFGSVYIFSKSLENINRSFLGNKKIPNKLMIINGVTCIFSGSLFLYGISSTIKNINNCK